VAEQQDQLKQESGAAATQLSEHFFLEEFERGGPVSEDCLPCLLEFCQRVLEPLRKFFDKPVRITSGNRNPEYNRIKGGAPNSQHIYERWSCAADIQVPGLPIKGVFDWLRLESGLPFDQVIFERGREERHEHDDCIHLSYLKAPRRMALEGSTHGEGGYQPRNVADRRLA